MNVRLAAGLRGEALKGDVGSDVRTGLLAAQPGVEGEISELKQSIGQSGAR